MKLSGIDFPKKLLDALSNDHLVVFAGAGVSMGEPANLLDFRSLAEAIAERTGKPLGDEEPEDQFFGKLKNDGVNVHEYVAEELCANNPQPTELHRNLLRLFLEPESVRIVTTNFDLLFERAAEAILDLNPEVFRAPALPVGNGFSGIVHVHGSVIRSSEMILTDADFGRAYIVQGWAQRFLVELFNSFTVLFVGYSHDDIIMNYLARALPEGKNITRFVLTKDDEIEKWKVLGIRPIVYPCSSDGDHSALYNGIDDLAEYMNWGMLEWQRRINELAEKEPLLLGEEKKDIIAQALSDSARTRFFVDTASSPRWIDWLDENGYLDGLFGNAELSEIDFQLANWLVWKFARHNPDQLFLLISSRGTNLNPGFWERLARFIGQDREQWDKHTLSRLICLLLSTSPEHPSDFVLLSLGERCIEHELLDDLVEIFDAMVVGRLELYAQPSFDADDPSLSVMADWKPTDNHYKVNFLWEKGLKPSLDRVAVPLLAKVIGHMETQHRRLSVWGDVDRDRNPASSHRSAIEPNEQDRHPESFDVLIDVARDCLEWLASKQPETVARLCDRLAETESPLLRRLAVHTSFVREDLTADEKIDWLLSNFSLHDIPTHHELFRAVTKTYPNAGQERRQKVINAVLSYQWENEEDENKDFYTAAVHIDWLNSLHAEKPDCGFAKQALEEVQGRFPGLQPSEHPEHLRWIGEAGFISPQSPWTVEELLSKSAEEWSENLLSFKQTEFLGLNRQALVSAIGEAAKKDFKWGLALAYVLVNGNDWDTDIWPALLNAWLETTISENQFQEVLQLLSRTELYDKNSLSVARILCALAKDDSESLPPNLLSQAHRIAQVLWENIHQEEVLSEKLGWPTRAINHPAGVLTQFWLKSLNLWRSQQDPIPEFFGDEYRSALSVIIQDPNIAGRLGRCILAGSFYFLLKVDEKWTRENLLPLLQKYVNEDDYHAAWDGFLQWQQLAPAIAELLEQPFLEAVERIKKDYPDRRQRSGFINAYATMVAYFVKNPIDTWIPKFFENADEEDKLDFASTIRWHLVHMNEEQKKELWERWLKSYWENRLKSIPPPPLKPREINRMLTWLPHLSKLFPEAVDLAIRMPSESLERDSIVYEVNESDLWRNYPDAVAKLLIYLGTCGLPDYGWDQGKELIGKLLQSRVPQELEEKLKELII